MPFPRFVIALPLIVVLAACGQSPTPPAAETPAATPPATAAPAANPPAAATPAATAPALPAAAVSLFGSWAADLRDCDSAAITISANRFEGAENQCDIAALDDNGDGSFTATLACTGEGQAATERVNLVPVFAPTGEGVTLSYLDRGGQKVTLLRCN